MAKYKILGSFMQYTMPHSKHAVQPASHLHCTGYLDCFTSAQHLLKFMLTRWSKIILIKIFFISQGDQMLTLLNMRK